MRYNDLGPLDGLTICPTCRTLKGRCIPSIGNSRRPRVQECRCERRARPRGEENPEWKGFDVPKAVELCYSCGLVPLRSGSRWCVWLCKPCATRAGELNGRAARPIVPIGRHSMMHGIGMSGPVKEDETEEIEAFCAAANGLFRMIERLEEWSRLRVGFNVERLGFDLDTPVALTRYLERAAGSADPDLSSEAAFEAVLQRLRLIAREEAR
jgi:hypothetical protein